MKLLQLKAIQDTCIALTFSRSHKDLILSDQQHFDAEFLQTWAHAILSSCLLGDLSRLRLAE